MVGIDQPKNILERRVRQQELVARLGERTVESGEDFESVLVAGVETIVEGTNANRAVALVFDQQQAVVRAECGWEQRLTGQRVSLTGWIERVRQHGEPQRQICSVECLELGSAAAGTQVPVVGVPVGPSTNPWGVLCGYGQGEAAFTDHDMIFLRSVTAVIGLVVGRDKGKQTTGTDASESGEGRAKQLHTEVNYQAIIETVSDGIYVTDTNGTFVTVNEAYANLTGYSKAALCGTAYARIVGPDIASQVANNARACVKTGGSATIEGAIQTADGEEIITESKFTARLSPDGTFQGIVGVVRDIRERKTRERKLEESRRQLAASNERLEQFASGISHDLREPLRMVTSYLELLDAEYGDTLEGNGEEFLEYALNGANRMEAMIEDLLAYSQIETQEPSFEPVDCTQVLESVQTDLSVAIEEHNAEISVGTLPEIDGDRCQLRQLFQNLVCNAITYCEGQPRIQISAEAHDGEWVIAVADNGIGIEPDATDQIFEVFNRLHTADEYSGTGIGLALCKRIVERHDGRIWVDSTPDIGSTFYIAVPAIEEEQ